MTSVLYDVPGPRAVLRNRIIGVITVLIIAGLLGFIIYRFAITGQFSAEKWYVFTFSAVWVQIAEATGRTLAAFASAAVLAIILGFVLAIGRMSDHAWIRMPVTGIVEVLRAVPVLVMMLLMYYGLPVIGIDVSVYWAVVIPLMLYNGSVLSEVIRAGVEALPRGQGEAGYAIGLRKTGVMSFVLLPQAIRSMLPVVIAQLVVTLKDTALGFIITYPELLSFAKLIGGQGTYNRPLLQAALVAAVIYITLCLILSGIAKLVEIRLRKSPRVIAAAAPLAQDGGTDTELLVAQREAEVQRKEDQGA